MAAPAFNKRGIKMPVMYALGVQKFFRNEKEGLAQGFYKTFNEFRESVVGKPEPVNPEPKKPVKTKDKKSGAKVDEKIRGSKASLPTD